MPGVSRGADLVRSRPMSPRKLSPSILAALGLSACVDGCDPADLPLVGVLFGDGGDDGGDGVHPCLKVAPCLEPVPTPPVGPCLEAPAVDTGPCLEIAVPTPVTNPVPLHPCLRMVPPPPPPPPPPSGPPGGAIQPSRPDVLASLVDEGVLAADVLERLPR